MARELPGVRPAVLGEASLHGLDALLRFRHFFRHAYAVRWDSGRLALLARTLVVLEAPLAADQDRFGAFLDELVTRLEQA